MNWIRPVRVGGRRQGRVSEEAMPDGIRCLLRTMVVLVLLIVLLEDVMVVREKLAVPLCEDTSKNSDNERRKPIITIRIG